MDRVRLFVSKEDYDKIKNGAEVAVECIMEEPMTIRKRTSSKFINIAKRIKNYIEENSEFTVTGILEEVSYEDRKILRIDVAPEFHICVSVTDYNKITDENLADILELIKNVIKDGRMGHLELGEINNLKALNMR